MRLIDADALYEKVTKEIGFPGWNIIPHAIENAPTIEAVPVVRCKDCKYYFQNNGHDKKGCPILDSHIWMDGDCYCSYGERKDDAD